MTTSTTNGTDYTLANGVLSVNNGFSGTITSTATFNNELQTKEIDFIYDHNGMRTGKIVSENGKVEITEYTLHGKLITHLTKRTVDENGDETIQELHFFYDGRTKLSLLEFNGNKYRYIYNKQGDVIAIIDTLGNTMVEYRYDVWGCHLVTGSMSNTLGKENPFRYRGYVYDNETGFYYLKTRYYCPEVNCFINDDILVSSAPSILGKNMFRYCLNNPIQAIDSDGRSSKKLDGEQPIVVDIPRQPVPVDIPRQKVVIDVPITSVHARRQLFINAEVARNKVHNPAGENLISWWIGMVGSGKPWDYKNLEGTERPTWLRDESFILEGYEIKDDEAYGNFHYGFVGYAMGFDPIVLTAGSIYAHFVDRESLLKGIVDFKNVEMKDWPDIVAGIEMAKNYY